MENHGAEVQRIQDKLQGMETRLKRDPDKFQKETECI